MELLGDDELSLVFNKIHKSDDRKSFFQVSKQFMRVACIRRIRLVNSYPAMLYDILPASPNLVRFRCHGPLSNSHMKLLAQSCTKLRYLLLYFGTSEFDFDDDGLYAVANFYTDLIHVHMGKRIHVGDVGIRSLTRSCKNLTMLDLGGCVRVTDESLRAIGDITSLVDLNLRGCYLITNIGLKYLANGNMKNLTMLDLGECVRVTHESLKSIREITSLGDLNLQGCYLITGSGLKYLANGNMKNLTRLDLSRCVRVTDKSLKAIAEITSLEGLNLQGCCLITDLGLKYLANGILKNLTDLDLSQCDRISDDGIIYLKHMVTLKYLYLSKCGVNVSDTGVVALLSLSVLANQCNRYLTVCNYYQVFEIKFYSFEGL